MAVPAETFFLDPHAEGTLQKQIQAMIARGILSGRFRPGEKMPSSRGLARHLGVSRITVTLAYTELVADDYLTAEGRSGYFVSANAPQPVTDVRRATGPGEVDWEARLAGGTAGPILEKPADWRRYPYPFIYGQADETLFDHRNWRLCAVQALGSRDFQTMTADAGDRDDPMLVEFIARHSLPRRGIAAGPDEILVTLGAQNALWLTAEILLRGNRRAVMEEPGYPGLRAILERATASLTTVDVDGKGLKVEDIPGKADVVYVTPSHQAPTCATLPSARRQRLLARASRDDFLVVEDDYEFEMALDAPVQPALKSLDRTERVIYVGSFSKSLFPGLRLGYLVGPAPFIAEARRLRSAMLRHAPGLIQRTAAYFLSLGHYDALIRRTARAFASRRAVMEDALAGHGLSRAVPGAGGSAVWMAASEGTDTAELAERLRGEGVLIEPGAAFFAAADAPPNFYRLAYSSIPAKRIPEGVARIAAALR